MPLYHYAPNLGQTTVASIAVEAAGLIINGAMAQGVRVFTYHAFNRILTCVERHLTILIVEDDPNDVVILQKALLRAGITNPLQIVNDGSEAIRYLQGEGKYQDRAEFPFPSVIFTDLKMPRMSGFDVLDWLRSHPSCSVIPVMVLSASKQAVDVKKAYEMGVNAYLVKPNSIEELTGMVKTAYDFWAICEKPAVPGNC